jgi:metal-responsive CopG/Arc/MetJ family transcriptional regulator
MKEREQLMRTHIALPEDLVEAVDRAVGKRGRSRFLAEAAREKLSRLDLLKTLEETAGAVKAADHPEWATPEDVAHWVRSLRQRESSAR